MSPDSARTDGLVDPDEFCRLIEAYICRKNDGHLIRISGPAFDMVRGWAEQGMPVNVAYAGIDRTFDRYYRKGPRRRPVHVTFCESDVLDVFEEWQRALGVPRREAQADVAGVADGSAVQEAHRPQARSSLPAHLERVVSRLTLLRGSDRASAGAWTDALEAAVRSLDTIKARARQARGDERAALLAELASLDRTLLERARETLDDGARAEIAYEAEAELAPFRERMSPEAHAAAVRAATDRLVRQAVGLPTVAYGD